MSTASRSWIPDTTQVSSDEVVGRRAFDKCFATGNGALNEGAFQLDVFYETRKGEHLSLDRLGERTADLAVLQHLLPICTAHAAAIRKSFVCWAAIAMKHLGHETIEASPDLENSNDYHCHLNLDAYRERNQRESLAFKLSTLAKPVHPPTK